jgi:hypothetical protein
MALKGDSKRAIHQADSVSCEMTGRFQLPIDNYTQRGHKLRFFRMGNAQFVTVGIISSQEYLTILFCVALPNYGFNTSSLISSN